MTGVGAGRPDRGARHSYRVSIRDEILLPHGGWDRWRELSATVVRTAAVDPGADSGAGPDRYVCERVESRTGTTTTTSARTEWTLNGGRHAMASVRHGDPTADGDRAIGPAAGEVTYPDLADPAVVDLLLRVSLDVAGLEVLGRYLTTGPSTDGADLVNESTDGADTPLSLRSVDPDTSIVIGAAGATVTRLATGMVDDRPSVHYAVRSLDRTLTIRSGELTQHGRCSSWGTVRVDGGTGDPLHADLVEMSITTVIDGSERLTAVRKRRLIRLDTGAGGPVRPWVSSPAPAVDPAALAVGPAISAVGPAISAVDPAILAEGQQLATRAARHVRQWYLGSRDALPAGVAELAMMGFQSVVGIDVVKSLNQMRVLRSSLRRWADGDVTAAAALREALPSHQQNIAGLVALIESAETEGLRLNVVNGFSEERIRGFLTTARDDLTRLLTLLEALRPPGDSVR